MDCGDERTVLYMCCFDIDCTLPLRGESSLLSPGCSALDVRRRYAPWDALCVSPSVLVRSMCFGPHERYRRRFSRVSFFYSFCTSWLQFANFSRHTTPSAPLQFLTVCLSSTDTSSLSADLPHNHHAIRPPHGVKQTHVAGCAAQSQ